MAWQENKEENEPLLEGPLSSGGNRISAEQWQREREAEGLRYKEPGCRPFRGPLLDKGLGSDGIEAELRRFREYECNAGQWLARAEWDCRWEKWVARIRRAA